MDPFDGVEPVLGGEGALRPYSYTIHWRPAFRGAEEAWGITYRSL